MNDQRLLELASLAKGEGGAGCPCCGQDATLLRKRVEDLEAEHDEWVDDEARAVARYMKAEAALAAERRMSDRLLSELKTIVDGEDAHGFPLVAMHSAERAHSRAVIAEVEAARNKA